MTGTTMKPKSAPAKRVSLRASVRWRMLGWVLLGTVLTMLAMIMTMRSVLLGRVALQANAAVEQEVREFRIFAREGRDPLTAQPFASLDGLIDLYLLRQTPDRGEAFVVASPENVLYLDNAPEDGGMKLAQDPERLAALVNAPEMSGIERGSFGEMRWGKTVAQAGEQRATFIVAYFTASDRQLVAQETLAHFGVALGGLLLIGALVWGASGQVLRPVRAINAAARRVDGRGPSPRVPVHGDDEMAELARTFNTMLMRVDQASIAQQHFIEQVQRHLGRAGQRARTHLAWLAGRGTGSVSPQEWAELGGWLDRVDQTLADLDLLLRATQPGFLHCKPAPLQPLGEQLLTLARAQRDVQGEPRQWQLAECAEGSAMLDAARVHDAMRHLLGNAVAHSSPSDTLVLGSALGEEEGAAVLRLYVDSPGPALSEEQARAVFAFDDLNGHGEGASHDDRGMGVGLAVARAVAEAHGGYAWVQAGVGGGADAPGQGNRFGITLPVSGPAQGLLDVPSLVFAGQAAPASG